MDNRGDPHPRYCRNNNNRDELSEKPTNATPTKRGTKRRERSREPERAPGCTFELIDRYDDLERCASTIASSPCEAWVTQLPKLIWVPTVVNQVDHRRKTATHEVVLMLFSVKMPKIGCARRPLKQDSEH